MRCQTIAEKERGRTDVEVKVGDDMFVIFEAKRGPWLPTEVQLRRYVPILARETVEAKRLVAVTNATDEHAKRTLPREIDDVPVLHVSWRTIRQLATGARPDETNRNKHLLDEFAAYLQEILGMETVRSNMVLVVVLSNGGVWGLNFKDVVKQRRYFDPVAAHRRGAHPSAVVRLTNLAMVLKDLGQPAEARPLLQRALVILEGTYGGEHPIVATSLTNLALVLKDLNQAAEAKPLLVRANRIAEKTLPANHPTRAKIAAHLAYGQPPPLPPKRISRPPAGGDPS